MAYDIANFITLSFPGYIPAIVENSVALQKAVEVFELIGDFHLLVIGDEKRILAGSTEVGKDVIEELDRGGNFAAQLERTGTFVINISRQSARNLAAIVTPIAKGNTENALVILATEDISELNIGIIPLTQV